MNGPPRLLLRNNSDLASRLLRSAEFDASPEPSKGRAMAVAAAAASTLASGKAAAVGTGLTAAMTGLGGVPLFAKWAGVGILAGVLALVGVEGARRGLGTPTPVAQPATTSTNGAVRSPSTIDIASNPEEVASSPTPAQPLPVGVNGSGSIASAPAKPPYASVATLGEDPIDKPTLPVENLAPVPSSSPLASAAGASPGERPADTLASELRSIDEVRQAVRRRDGANALRLLARYESEYPRGHFGQEATALRVESLVLLGRRAEATALGSAFIQSHPSSAHVDRIRALLQ